MPQLTLEAPPVKTPTPADPNSEDSAPKTKSKFDDWRCELDGYYLVMQTFCALDPHSVFMRLSAFSARVSEMRSQLARDDSRRALALRTREVEPFLDECDRQFKFHSRALTITELEFKISGGAT